MLSYALIVFCSNYGYYVTYHLFGKKYEISKKERTFRERSRRLTFTYFDIFQFVAKQYKHWFAIHQISSTVHFSVRVRFYSKRNGCQSWCCFNHLSSLEIFARLPEYHYLCSFKTIPVCLFLTLCFVFV